MTTFILISQASMSVVIFAAILTQLFWFRRLNLEAWHRFTWFGIGFQILAIFLAALAVVVFEEAEPLMLLPTILLIVSNTAWLCWANLLLTIAIPIRPASRAKK